MRGDLLTKMRKLVKGLAKPTPAWLKAMEEAPPVKFPCTDGKVKQIVMPEDVYVKKFFKKHPDSLYHDAVKISSFDPPPARVFAWRVLELREHGVSEEEAMALADMEYQAEKKAKKKAYTELKQISRLQGKRPPPNPHPKVPSKRSKPRRKICSVDRFLQPEDT
ncbi:hypothetical protein J5N97_027047 [Dioscorea zingiberensis]|uniref:Small ribosomal subunit protein mS23 n=1 Tax=Dioscorea zingiberensis TaxID=325984 RepID=A0A9D5C4J1_9LILI|nr:hypothetical protein J5N97_027047 [Dioscorea zingiberensis]